VGQYQISVEMPGFRTTTSGTLMLKRRYGGARRLQVAVGSRGPDHRSERLGGEVNTENARLSQTVDSTMIANLPLNGRNVYDLIQYAPGRLTCAA